MSEWNSEVWSEYCQVLRLLEVCLCFKWRHERPRRLGNSRTSSSLSFLVWFFLEDYFRYNYQVRNEDPKDLNKRYNFPILLRFGIIWEQPDIPYLGNRSTTPPVLDRTEHKGFLSYTLLAQNSILRCFFTKQLIGQSIKLKIAKRHKLFFFCWASKKNQA